MAKEELRSKCMTIIMDNKTHCPEGHGDCSLHLASIKEYEDHDGGAK